MSELYIVVENDTLEPHQSIKDAIASFENLSEFVVEERSVFCLTYKGKGDWEIEAVPLKDIAKSFLETVE